MPSSITSTPFPTAEQTDNRVYNQIYPLSHRLTVTLNTSGKFSVYLISNGDNKTFKLKGNFLYAVRIPCICSPTSDSVCKPKCDWSRPPTMANVPDCPTWWSPTLARRCRGRSPTCATGHRWSCFFEVVNWLILMGGCFDAGNRRGLEKDGAGGRVVCSAVPWVYQSEWWVFFLLFGRWLYLYVLGFLSGRAYLL